MDPGQDPQQRGLAVAVAADDADDVAAGEPEADRVQERPGAERDGDPFGVDEVAHGFEVLRGARADPEVGVPADGGVG